MATGGGKVARSCPSDECCSPRPLNLGRLSLARPRSPAPAFAVARGMAWLNAPIDVAPTKEGVPVHPHLNPAEESPKLSRPTIPPQTSAPHPTTLTANTGHDIHVTDFELGTGHMEVRHSVARDTTEWGRPEVPVVLSMAPLAVESAHCVCHPRPNLCEPWSRSPSPICASHGHCSTIRRAWYAR